MKLVLALFGLGLFNAFAQNPQNPPNNNPQNPPNNADGRGDKKPALKKYVPCLKQDIGINGLGKVGGWFRFTEDLPKGVWDNNDAAIGNVEMKKELLDTYQVKKVFKQTIQLTSRYSIMLNSPSGDNPPICALVSQTGADTEVQSVHTAIKRMLKPKRPDATDDEEDEDDETTEGFQKRYRCHETDIPERSQLENVSGGWKQDGARKEFRKEIYDSIQDAKKKGEKLDALQEMLNDPDMKFNVRDCWHQVVNGKNQLCEVQVQMPGAPNICVKYNNAQGKIVFIKIHNALFPDQTDPENDVNFGEHGDKNDKKQKDKKKKPKKFRPCYKDVAPEGEKDIPGGWKPANFDKFNKEDKDTEEVMKNDKCKGDLKKRFGRFFFKKDVSFRIADVWKQTVSGTNFLVEIHAKGIRSPICLRFHKPLGPDAKPQFTSIKISGKDNKITADDFIDSFFLGMPKGLRPKRKNPKKDHQDGKKKKCAEQMIGKGNTDDNVRDGFRKAEEQDTKCPEKVIEFLKKHGESIKKKVPDFDNSKPDEIKKHYRIRECWKKTSDAEDVVAEIEPEDEKKKKFCVKFRKPEGQDSTPVDIEPRADRPKKPDQDNNRPAPGPNTV